MSSNLNLPRAQNYAAFSGDASFDFLVELGCNFTLKANIFSRHSCICDCPEVHLATVIATSIVTSDFFVEQFARCADMAGTDITTSAVRSMITGGFRLDYIRFGKNFNTRSSTIRDEPAFSRTILINPLLVLNGVPYAHSSKQKVLLAQYMAGLIVHEVGNVLYNQICCILNKVPKPITISNGYTYNDFGDLIERYLWGGSLEIVEPKVGNHTTLSCAVEMLLIVQHSIMENTLLVNWNPVLLSQKAIDTCVDLQFPCAPLEEIDEWERGDHGKMRRGRFVLPRYKPTPPGVYRS